MILRYPFQSTHPTRGCDRSVQFEKVCSLLFQSTHPTRGCDGLFGESSRAIAISIHAPHEGVRPEPPDSRLPQVYFNPRTPRGGATSPAISSDFSSSHFNPRTPRGGATTSTVSLMVRYPFQSTHPTRGCDDHQRDTHGGVTSISIHAPHEGVRPWLLPTAYSSINFNPRTPRGGATLKVCIVVICFSISIHAPHEGVRPLHQLVFLRIRISIHAPHEGVRHRLPFLYLWLFYFNPRTPRGGATEWRGL